MVSLLITMPIKGKEKTNADEVKSLAKAVATHNYFRLAHRRLDNGVILARICETYFHFSNHAEMYSFAAKVLEIAAIEAESIKD
jgi:hypothetical protein